MHSINLLISPLLLAMTTTLSFINPSLMIILIIHSIAPLIQMPDLFRLLIIPNLHQIYSTIISQILTSYSIISPLYSFLFVNFFYSQIQYMKF